MLAGLRGVGRGSTKVKVIGMIPGYYPMLPITHVDLFATILRYTAPSSQAISSIGRKFR